MAVDGRDGGYDEGYRSCECFWGREPGSLVKQLVTVLPDPRTLTILDAGCGEGKNAAFLAGLGATVDAFDVSALSVENARRAWPDAARVTWEVADIRESALAASSYDVVIAYGLLHCMSSADEISVVVSKLQRATREGGYNVICAFNRRFQDLTAHPGFNPCLVDHDFYLGLYQGWHLIHVSDSDLTEVHPHNQIRHTHSLTRIIARRAE
jgi:tellurite methyltransferase